MNAVVEKMGLSQTQLYDSNDTFHKVEDEVVSVSSESDPPEAHSRQDDEAARGVQDGKSEIVQLDNEAQTTTALETNAYQVLSHPEQSPKAILGRSSINPNYSQQNIETGSDVSYDTNNDRPGVIENPLQLAKITNKPNDHKSEGHSEAITDSKDFASYQDEEDEHRKSSSRSSTLQGDIIDPTSNEVHVIFDKVSPSFKTAEDSEFSVENAANQATYDTAAETGSGQIGIVSDSQPLGPTKNDPVSFINSEGQIDIPFDDHNVEEEEDKQKQEGILENSENKEDEDILEEFENGDEQDIGEDSSNLHTNYNRDTAFDPQENEAAYVHFDPEASLGDETVKTSPLENEKAEEYQYGLDHFEYDNTESPYPGSEIGETHSHYELESDQEKITLDDTRSKTLDGGLNPRNSANDIGQDQEDIDEITYEDDESDGENLEDQVSVEQNTHTNSRSLKRTRSFNSNEAPEAQPQGKQVQYFKDISEFYGAKS